MAKRSNTTAKNIRSQIKHSNVHLGTGVELERISHSQLQQHRSAANNASLHSPLSQPALYHLDSPSASSQLEGSSYGFSTVSEHQQQQAAGPSFASLAPLDSISNYEGRQARHANHNSHHQHQPSTSSKLSAAHSRQASQHSLFSRPLSPSAESAASFARQINDPDGAGHSQLTQGSNTSIPNRPQRSMRRPVGMSGPPSAPPLTITASNSGSATRSTRVPGLSVIPPLEQQSSGRHARSACLMAQVNHVEGVQGGRDTPMSQQSDNADEIEDAYGGLSPVDRLTKSPFADSPSQLGVATPKLGSLSKSVSPASLGSVLSALSAAGRKNQGRRIMRGMTAEEESRRRRVERKMDEARHVEFRDISHYQRMGDEGGVGRIGAVYRKIKTEWRFVTEDDFNPVAMALSLLDNSSLGFNRQQFDQAKLLIEKSLQGTVEDHYESFATAITLHNSVLASLTNVQSSIYSSRRRLQDSREALGSKRADLVQLWHRQQSVKDALRLLHTVEQLRAVPDRLEMLLSEKHFLTAVNLLLKALKAIEKPDIQEIGATSDLRTYLRSQEGHILEIIVEEIHSHLYLKSPYCDRRWRGYVAGEERLPDVKWGIEYEHEEEGTKGRQPRNRLSDLDEKDEDEVESLSGRLPSAPFNKSKNSSPPASQVPVKLARYLGSLSSRRVLNEVGKDLDELDTTALDVSGPSANGIPNTPGDEDGSPPEGTNDPDAQNSGHQAGGEQETQDAMAAAEFQENPEADSFLYMEMLLEALARLGKLGVAIEAIHQRLPIEIHSLVEATIREVEVRSEPWRRSPLAALRPESALLASSSVLARTFGAGESGHASYPRISSLSSLGAERHGSRPMSILLRISSAESSQVQSDGEIMRDLFWTLFSKLDAVLQGHRVVHEVASLITQRPGFRESAVAMAGSVASIADKLRGRLVGGERLLDVWRPIQTEVRTLLHEYLVDDTQSPSARRNNVTSVNDVLKKGNFSRDRSRKLFHLTDRKIAATTVAPLNGPASAARHVNTAQATKAMASKRDWTPIKRHEESLDAALRFSVPGLVNAAETQGASNLFSNARMTEQSILLSSDIRSSFNDNQASDFASGSHRLLVKPDAFNISVLFQPALAFVDRVKVVMPREAAGETSKGFSAFLDEFIQDMFLPQLEEKAQSLFQGAVGGTDAFQEDSASRNTGISAKPIVKSAINVVVLMDSLYSMLRTTPFHREKYSRLIIQTVVQYYARCHDRFKELVACPADTTLNTSHDVSLLVLSATWARHGTLASVLADLKDAEDKASAQFLELQDRETQIEIQLASHRPSETVQLNDLITSRKKLMALSHLQHSLKWLLTHISRLKATDESLPVSSRPTARLSINGGIGTAGLSTSSEWELKLPLSPDMASRFETLPRTYSLLSDTVLFTLRLELRARVLHHLDMAVSEGNYLVEESSAEPDPHVVDLNAELSNLDDTLADCLSAEDHRFLFEGMANLMDTMLVASVRKLRAINRPGVSKMIRNILALQQNLKNIIISDSGGFAAAAVAAASYNPAGSSISSQQSRAQPSPAVVSFDSSRSFWELLFKSPDDMLRAVRSQQRRRRQLRRPTAKFGFEELKSALQLMLGLDNTPPNSSIFNANGEKKGSSSGGAASSIAAQSTTAPLSITKSFTTTGPSTALPRAGTINIGKEGVISRQKFNEYLIELHQVLEEGEE